MGDSVVGEECGASSLKAAGNGKYGTNGTNGGDEL
jgi:hypothetical protein